MFLRGQFVKEERGANGKWSIIDKYTGEQTEGRDDNYMVILNR